jgi:putative DNA primase/helicase
MSKRNTTHIKTSKPSQVKACNARCKVTKQAQRDARYRRRLRRAAGWYLELGLQILPLHGAADGECSCGDRYCTSPGKHPRIKGGAKSASNDPDVVFGWIDLWAPKLNLAIATGEGCTVIDVDPRHGGDKTLSALEAELGPLPRDFASRTGGGGEHVYFDAPSTSVPTSHNKVGPGINVQSVGAYVVAAPSRHVSGGHYTWEGLKPWRIEGLPTLPASWLAKLMRKEAAATAEGSGATPGKITEGARNTALTKIAGQLHRSGLSTSALLAALLAENTCRCAPPLDEAEVERIVQSVSGYATPAGSIGEDKAEFAMRAVVERHYAGGANLIHAADQQFWAFDGRRWSVVPRNLMGGLVLETIVSLNLPRSGTASLVNQTTNLLASKVAVGDDRLRLVSPPEPVINCKNGELWIASDGTVELRPHRAGSYLRHVVDVDYDPNARCPEYDRAVTEIFSGNKAMVRHWHELVGSIVQPARKIPLVVILEGGGGTARAFWRRPSSGFWATNWSALSGSRTSTTAASPSVGCWASLCCSTMTFGTALSCRTAC